LYWKLLLLPNREKIMTTPRKEKKREARREEKAERAAAQDKAIHELILLMYMIMCCPYSSTKTF
jgi:hypothetical protein